MSEQLSLFEKAMLSDNLTKKKKSVKRYAEWLTFTLIGSIAFGIVLTIMSIG